MRAPSVAVALLLPTSLAAAAPVASLREDLDGNGTQEAIELGADGTLDIGGSAKVKVSSSVTKGKIAVAGPQLVVDVTSGTAREGVVLDRKGGWHVVARFPLGGVGLDREYGVEVDASAAGIVRYQTRWDVQRCDDKPAYLFAERLDGTTWRALDKLPARLPATVPVLPARLDTGAAPAGPPLIFQARAASHQPGATDAGALAIPRELDDGRLDTTWREELASHGEGQFFTFKSRVEAARAQQLRIVPGQASSAQALRAASRPHRMAIVARQGAWRFELPDAINEPLGAAYVVDLPAGLGECVTVILESAHGRGPTAIAELGIYATDERTGGGASLLAKVVATGSSGATGAAAQLAKLGAAGARAIEDELARTTDAATRRRLVAALAKNSDPAATASLVRAASEGWVRDQDLRDVIGALAAANQIGPLRELATRSTLPLDMRVAAVQGLRPVGPGLVALVDLAGRGGRELRRAVIERLAAAPADALLQAATSQAEAAVAGDVWRALTRHLRTDVAARPAAVAAMVAALPGATDYERRYRLVDGIAAYGDPAALAVVERTLRALPAGAEAAALRQVAVRAIASSPRKEAAPLVVAAARDPEPGVRLAALAALADAETDTAGAWHGPDGPDAIDRVIVNAMADTWPEIRRRAATALGGRCQRPGPARVLFEAVGKDRDLDVRGDALVALVQCRATGVRELLPHTWNNAQQPAPIRQRAIDLVVTLDDRALAARLVKEFVRWRGQAIESKDAMLLATSAAATLGRMAPPGAAQVLADALDDTAFPEIVSAAALGLGALGPRCPSSAKAKLQVIARSGDRAAIAARAAVAACGR